MSYSNTNGSTGRNIDQSSRRVGGLKAIDASTQGYGTSSVTAWFNNDGVSNTGYLQCWVYDHNGNRLSQIGNDIDISTLTSSYVEYTFTATPTQQVASRFSTGQNGYVGFSIDGTGLCNILVWNTTSTISGYTPQKSTSNSDPYSFVNWDNPDWYYMTGTWTLVASPVGGDSLLFPPPVAYI